MEFNILPRAKILSPHSNNKLNQNTTQTVNVIVSESGERKKSKSNENTEIKNNDEESESKYEVKYENREVKLEDEPQKLSKEDSISTINFLKLVLESYMNNPIKYNNYIICSVPVLENLIETLSSCDDCNVEIEDLEINCCGNSKNHIVPIRKIWCKNGDSSELFKYKYSQYLQIFDYYRISLKFVFVE